MVALDDGFDEAERVCNPCDVTDLERRKCFIIFQPQAKSLGPVLRKRL
jgi:hypothetical protein